MSKQSRADSEGYQTIHLGSALSGGGGTARSNAGVGRKGRNQQPKTAREIRALKKVVAAEKAAAAKEIKARKAAARAAKKR